MKYLIVLLLLGLAFQSCEESGATAGGDTETMTGDDDRSSDQDGPYEADWESLAKANETPEWFADSKLGIYAHWGPYTVPEFGNEWYPRFMYDVENDAFEHHKKTYGDQSEFGYHDFIPSSPPRNSTPTSGRTSSPPPVPAGPAPSPSTTMASPCGTVR